MFWSAYVIAVASSAIVGVLFFNDTPNHRQASLLVTLAVAAAPLLVFWIFAVVVEWRSFLR